MIKKLICFGLAAVAALTLVAGELHPETQTFLAGMPSGLAELQTKAIREAIAGNGALLKQVRNSRKVDTVPPSGVTTEELSFEGLPIRLYRTPGPVRVLVLYLHGGGWVLGGIPSCSRFCGALAEQEEVAVAACDYRLAPEHPYPAALDDTVKFYDWAKQRYPGARIILAGDSAGGNLAVAAALRLLDERKKTVDGLILFYPVASLQQDRSESWKKNGFERAAEDAADHVGVRYPARSGRGAGTPDEGGRSRCADAPLRRRAAYFHLDAGAGHLLRPGAEGKRRLYRKINGLR